MENQDKAKIRNMFETFVNAWQSRETSVLDNLLLPDCNIDFSIFEKGMDRKSFEKELAIRTREVSYSRFEIYNFVCCVGNNIAQQSGTICGMFVDEHSDRPANFGFTGKMVNSLVKTESGWKYSAMRFELAGESDNHGRLYTSGVGIIYKNGDTSFVQNWRLVPNEVGWHESSRLLSIIPEIDAPWYAIPDRCDIDSDEDQIKETLYRYCFALDFDCIELYDDVFSDDAMIVYGDSRKYDKRSATAMLRFEREGGIGSHHVLYADQINITGNLAKVKVYRAGMDYIPSEKIMWGEEKKKNYLCGRYDMKFIKEKGKWHILKLNYYQGHLVRPRPAEIFTCSTGN